MAARSLLQGGKEVGADFSRSPPKWTPMIALAGYNASDRHKVMVGVALRNCGQLNRRSSQLKRVAPLPMREISNAISSS